MNIPTISLKKIKKRYIVLGLLGLFIIFSIIKNAVTPDTSKEFFTVEEGIISETLILAGDIDIEDRVDLGFGVSGRVSQVLVEEGQMVKKDDVLARLSMSQLSAELLEAEAGLRQAEAQSRASQVDLDFANQNLENTIQEQDVLVENAYRALLNNDLQAYTEESENVTPPIISGSYFGEEGEYVISPYRSSSPSGYSFNFSGLESGFATVQTNTPVALGEKGLYIQFNDGDDYSYTEWVVSIPNKRSSSYTAKKNAYDQAVATRALAIATAEDTYRQAEALETNGSISNSMAEVLAARARVDAIRARMSDGIITAPFDGTVGIVDLAPGEIVSANTPYITLVGGEQFELVLDVPEIDVAKLELGDSATISLDAYADGSVWQGIISSVDVIDTVVDGVPVYKTTVVIANPDERIRVGMGAKATILAQEKQNVLRAPQYFFERTENGYEAKIRVSEKREKVIPVSLGLLGSDGFVEIQSGLQSGDILVRTKDVE